MEWVLYGVGVYSWSGCVHALLESSMYALLEWVCTCSTGMGFTGVHEEGGGRERMRKMDRGERKGEGGREGGTCTIL